MPEVLLVSLGATAGLRVSDAELASGLERAGVSVRVVAARAPREVRTLALTDLAWARAARAAALRALADRRAAAVIYSTITAALLAPRPGAIRFDALAAANRPGRHGIWQRPRERVLLARAPLLLPVSEQAQAGLPTVHAPMVILPIAVAASGPLAPPAARDVAAVTYAADAEKKGLDRVLAAWSAARHDGEELLVAGGAPVPSSEGVRNMGVLAPAEFRALLRRARIYVAAPRREEYGLAALEALADGAMLVAAAEGARYPALTIAGTADPRLVSGDLAAAIRIALDDPRAGYAAAAAAALEPFSPAQVDRVLAREVLPLLLGS